MATRQNKSSVYLLILTTTIITTLFKRINHTIRYFFHVLILIVNPFVCQK